MADDVVSSDRMRFARNSAAMLLIQLLNQLVPLVTVPYLARALGAETFGVLSFGIAGVAFAHVLTDVGFGIGGAYTISRHRTNKLYVECISFAAVVTKLGVFLAILPIYILYFGTRGMESTEVTFIFFLLVVICFDALAPTWIYQGLEMVGRLIIFSLIGRIGYLVIIFSAVEGPSDLSFIAIALMFAHGTPVILGYTRLYLDGYRVRFPKKRILKKSFLYAQSFYYSRLAVASYTSLGTLVLGYFASATTLGFFGAAQQLYKALQQLTGSLAGILLPYMAARRDIELFKLLATIMISLATIFCIGVAYWARDIVWLIFGEQFRGAEFYLQLFIAAFWLYVVSVFLGHALFAGLGIGRLANRTFVLAGIVNMMGLLLMIIADSISAAGVCMVIILSELVANIYRVILIRRLYIR